MRNGHGCYEWLFGQKFEGNFTNGLIQGKGVFHWKERIKDEKGNEKVIDKALDGIFSNEKIQFFQKEINYNKRKEKLIK